MTLTPSEYREQLRANFKGRWWERDTTPTPDDVPYEDEDQRLGGNDNPYPED